AAAWEARASTSNRVSSARPNASTNTPPPSFDSGRVGQVPGEGQVDPEDGAAAGPVVDPDAAPVDLGHVLDDGQAQAGAPSAAGPARVGPVETLEHAAPMFGGYARAAVADLDPDTVVLTPGRQGDLAPCGGVPQRVIQQVSHSLSKQLGIGFDGERRGVEACLQPGVAQGGQRATCFDDLLQQAAQV